MTGLIDREDAILLESPRQPPAGSGWPLDTQHLGEQALSDRQRVIVIAVTHHEQPTRQTLLEAMGTVARYRHHDLLEKRVGVSKHQTSEGRHRVHGACERRARYLCRAPRDLNEKPDGGALGTEDGLHAGATLPSDRCHLDDTAVRIDRHHRDDPAMGEVDMVERAIGVHQDLPMLAGNVVELRHEPLEIAGRQGEQEPIAGPIRYGAHTPRRHEMTVGAKSRKVPMALFSGVDSS
jgi:hypothetical protein